LLPDQQGRLPAHIRLINSFWLLFNLNICFFPLTNVDYGVDTGCSRPVFAEEEVTGAGKLLELLDQGYAMVAFYRLAFFGFKKQLLRKIGMFDERFVGGGFEDDDFYIRLKEANLGVYIAHEIPYTKSSSGWNYSLAQGHFVDKWGNVAQIGKLKRTLEEEQYQYDLGTEIPVEFLPWDQSVILTTKVKKYTKYSIVK
jgi:GT2 family glycosyltransferase